MPIEERDATDVLKSDAAGTTVSSNSRSGPTGACVNDKPPPARKVLYAFLGVVVPLYRASVARLRSQIEGGSLVPMLSEQFRHQMGYNASPAEVRSWERSLQVLSGDLVDAGLGEVEVLVEYQLPLTSKRADVVLCGHNPRTGAPSYVVVELKQWSRAAMLDGATTSAY